MKPGLSDSKQKLSEAEIHARLKDLAGWQFQSGRLHKDFTFRNFQEAFGFGMQVFRKAGNSWVLTTMTDDWTLAHQNEEGKEDSKKIEAEKIETAEG